MPMDRNTFLNCIIDDGIYEIETNYTKPHQQLKREGGVKAFNDCRGKTDKDLLNLHQDAHQRSSEAFSNAASDYWYHRMYTLQVEWVLNVLSAVYYNQNLPILVEPTARGAFKAADILGIAKTEVN